MEDSILAKIIQTEGDIQAKVEAARKRCTEQTQRLKEEAETRIVSEESRIREKCRRSLEEAGLPARQKAAAILEAASRHAEKLRRLDDETLKQIIMREIIRILPGERR
jgi:vacuolar-type H+-ATPase subunit H